MRKVNSIYLLNLGQREKKLLLFFFFFFGASGQQARLYQNL